jgi:glutamate synthase domain-containing protein 2
MAINYIVPEYEVLRDPQRCIACRVCERQCANEVHRYDPELNCMRSDETKCVNCHRCVSLCPTHALKIVKNSDTFKLNDNWSNQTMTEIYREAEYRRHAAVLYGQPEQLPESTGIKCLINASQVTNPSIDPLREPMETRVYLGRKPDHVERKADGTLKVNTPPQLRLDVPIMFSAMSYGAISYNAHESLGARGNGTGHLLQHRRGRPAS